MDISPHLPSNSGDWGTPTDLFQELDEIFHFDVDASATANNAKCLRYFTPQDNALNQRWTGTVWMNPPYGRQIEAFVRKAFEESRLGATVICLLPSRTDTRWWHRYARRGQIIFLRGRLKFSGCGQAAPFPSAVVIFWGGRLGDALAVENNEA